MNIKTIAIGLPLLLSSLAFADLKSDWQKKLEDYCGIVKTRNVKAFDRWCSDNCASDFRFVSLNGRPFFLKDWSSMVKQDWAKSDSVRNIKFQIDSASVQKDTATMRMTTNESVTSKNSRGKTETQAFIGHIAMQLVKKGGKWRLKEVRVYKDK